MPSSVSDLLLSFLFPIDCLSCGERVERYADTPACIRCWEESRLFSSDDLLCARCGVYFGPRETDGEVFCRKCDGHYYDIAFACGNYDMALKASIVHMKETPRLFPTLRGIIRSALEPMANDDIDLVVPVPLSRRRRHDRGFNQAEIIARACAKKLKRPMDAVSLTRSLDTPIHRAGMDAKARAASVEGAFSVVRPRLIEGNRILLVDDVLTSGATASNCAKALKNSGAASVTVFTLARAVLSEI